MHMENRIFNLAKHILTAITCVLAFLVVGSISLRETKADAAYQQSLIDAGFPKSYVAKLDALHEKHKNWKFVPVKAIDNWAIALENECKAGRKLVYSSKISLGTTQTLDDGTKAVWFSTPTAWKMIVRDSTTSHFNFKTDKFNTDYDSGSWFQASKEAIAYVMDPRNWLTEKYIYCFETLYYHSAVSDANTVKYVNSLLNGTFMYNKACPGAPKYSNTYAKVIADAAKKYNVSALHLASRLRLEKGTSNDVLGKGVVRVYDSKAKKYIYRAPEASDSGLQKYYNYFNIGAGGNGAEIINNGGNEAYENGWTSPYKAIVGGAKKVYDFYIDLGQDTIYFEMFNVAKDGYLYWKQYAQNLTADLTECASIYDTYETYGLLNRAVTFRIPVYSSMPSSNPRPKSPSGSYFSTANPNCMLKSITIYNGKTKLATLSPDYVFGSNWTYSKVIEVPYEVENVTINMNPVNSTAKKSGNGTKNLVVGNNKFTVTCTSAYGGIYKRSYTFTIKRKDGSTRLKSASNSDGSFTKTFNMDTYSYNLFLENSVSSTKLNFATESAKATVKYSVNGATAVSCTTGVVNAKLNVGHNTVKLYVHHDGSGLPDKTSVYTFNIYRYTPMTMSYTYIQKTDKSSAVVFVNGFVVGETLAEAGRRFSFSGTCKWYGADNVLKSDSDLVANGDKISVYDGNGLLYKNVYIILYGDVDCNGIIDYRDYDLMNRNILSTTVQKEAANVDDSTAGITGSDLSMLKSYIEGKGSIFQVR